MAHRYKILLKQFDTTIAPVYETDFPMFMHCTGGYVAVTAELFYKNHASVFEMHDIEVEISATGSTKGEQ
jgi:hypothetical protein